MTAPLTALPTTVLPTTGEVRALAAPEILVEVEAIAILGAGPR